MGKSAFKLIIILLLFIANVSIANASMVTIDKNGELIWNVLSEETSFEGLSTHSFIEVKKVKEEGVDKDASVSLEKNGDEISMMVTSDNETRELSLSQPVEDLVEVEERPEVERVLIGFAEGRFILSQSGITAKTELPLNINSKTSRFSLTTKTGDVFLAVLPKEAVETAIRTKLLSKADSGNVEIEETEGKLQYKIEGEKIFNFLELYDYSIPVTAYISAASGEVVGMDSPTLFKYLRFLYI